jgi:hypothetical protein
MAAYRLHSFRRLEKITCVNDARVERHQEFVIRLSHDASREK